MTAHIDLDELLTDCQQLLLLTLFHCLRIGLSSSQYARRWSPNVSARDAGHKDFAKLSVYKAPLLSRRTCRRPADGVVSGHEIAILMPKL